MLSRNRQFRPSWTRAARRLAAVSSLIVLAACTSTPKGFLIPTGVEAPGTSLVDMLVLTTRNPTPARGVIFGGGRDQGFSMAEIVVSLPPDANRRIGAVQWPDDDAPDPSREFTTVSIKPSDPANTQAWFDRVAGPKARLMIFVHG